MTIADDMLDDWLSGLFDDIDDEEDYYYSQLSSGVVKCTRCGSKKVHWRNIHPGWRLFNNGTDEMHYCNHMADSEFEDLTE